MNELRVAGFPPNAVNASEGKPATRNPQPTLNQANNG